MAQVVKVGQVVGTKREAPGPGLIGGLRCNGGRQVLQAPGCLLKPEMKKPGGEPGFSNNQTLNNKGQTETAKLTQPNIMQSNNASIIQSKGCGTRGVAPH